MPQKIIELTTQAIQNSKLKFGVKLIRKIKTKEIL